MPTKAGKEAPSPKATPKRIFLETKKIWGFLDGSEKGKVVQMPPGRYEVERIPNPFGHENVDWLVLAGTRLGATELFWRGWENPEDPDLEVIITEE